jgi:hypothetical protein
MEIRPVGADRQRTDRGTYGQTDGQTNIKKVIIAFRQYAKAPEMKFLDQMSKY